MWRNPFQHFDEFNRLIPPGFRWSSSASAICYRCTRDSFARKRTQTKVSYFSVPVICILYVDMFSVSM